MEGQEEPLSDTDTTSSTDLELAALDNLRCSQPSASQPSSQPSASTLTAQPSKLQTYSSKQDYKSPNVQRVQLKKLHYLLQVHLLNNAITSFSSCAHQKLTDASLTILMTNMQGRILKEKLKDTNGIRQGCSIQRMTNLKIVSNLQFLVVHFYSYYIIWSFIHINIISCIPKNFVIMFVYAQECKCIYLYVVYAQEFHCCCTILFSQVCSGHY